MKILGSVSDQIVVVHLQVLLKGTCRDKLKKIKYVVRRAVLTAYHISVETSFLADDSVQDEEIVGLNPAIEGLELLGRHLDPVHPTGSMNCRVGNAPSDACYDDLASSLGLESSTLNQCEDFKGPRVLPSVMRNHSQQEPQESMAQDQMLAGEMNSSTRSERADESESNFSLFDDDDDDIGDSDSTFSSSSSLVSVFPAEEKQNEGNKEPLTRVYNERADENEVSSEYFSATETHQSILVSISCHCVLKGIVCERSRLLRIKFHGRFDKPLGRYLRDDLFDKVNLSCFLSFKLLLFILFY